MTRTLLLTVTALLTPMTALAAGDAKTPWYADPVTLTAFLALVVFLFIVHMMGGFKTIFGQLDARAEGIQNQIDEAKALREEASRLMAEAELKAKEAETAAEDIINRAKADAKALMKQSEADLAAKVARREAQAEARIARAETEAANDVRRIAADAATAAARTILSDNAQDDQFDRALADIESRLN